ncbi:hypothetical protein [Paenibacillus jilunlii]|uniref:Lipoprotein n=1 Tax=Paenibacillus jilunlii TaxID=682956 RepID=A0A1G9GKW5_9BACL|nr:hypothetical protein [Paenibacillus jilunlii]KWX78643.1 hypothetical protein AML91_04930 [Paenibacillus jilunlii]SDL01297.1 hypothetical protein SAMN05216191_101458 [Paenibacillus jilunlii]
MLKLFRMTVIVLLLVTAGCNTQEKDSAKGGQPGRSPAAAGQTPQVTPVSPEAALQPAVTHEETGEASGSKPSVEASNAVPAAFLDPAKLSSSFGFADSSGKRILAASDDDSRLAEMESLNTAIGNNGRVFSVTLEKWQPGSADSNGRDMANNFANLSGYVFTVEDGKAASDETYYLANSAELDRGSLLAVKPSADNSQQLDADNPVRKQILALKKRHIQSIWKLADLSEAPEDLHLYVVQFVRQNTNMLFSLVLQKGPELSFMDYPAEIRDDEYSVWRVDDGGEITPGMFSLLFAARTLNGVALGVNWWGAEGVNSFFLLQQNAGFKEMGIEYGRYTSPL